MESINWMEVGAALAAMTLGAVHGYAQFKKTGKIGLDKTLELAPDVLHLVLDKKAAAAEKGDEAENDATEEGIADAVKEVAKLRGRRLGKKLVRKLGARLRTMVRERS